MILNNENIKLFKFDVKWNEVFKSISNCSYIEHLRRREIDSVPLEIKNFILKYHSNPIIWFYGQLLNYIWKENEKTLNLTNKIVSKIPFECGPIVGIHVRRTDKIKEAKLYELEEYMKWVDFWFDINEENYKNTNLINLNCTNKRMLFVAADIPVLKNVIEEIKNKWGNKYEIYHGTIFKNETQYKSREALIEILDIFRILAKCQFLVCTFSSSTCQLIYELMQVFQGDASENVHSLDYLYGLGRKLEATTDYKPNHEHPIMPEELWAEKGDIILALSSVHNDGRIFPNIINVLTIEHQFYNNSNYNNTLKLIKLGEKIKLALDLLQNPINCSNAKILFCVLDGPDWGLGYLLHQIYYCFISAIESGRTMILNNENIKLFKFDVKWNEVFKSTSNCSYIEYVQPFLPLKEYFNKEQTDRITSFNFPKYIVKRTNDAIPLPIKNLLIKYHSTPIIWFYGQIINYIMGENEEAVNKIHQIKWVDFWFDINEENYKNKINLNCTNKRMLYIATDEPNVFNEAKIKYGNKYEIYHQKIFQNETQYKSKESLIELLALYKIIAKCQFLVCTFSSSTCQLIYELMQVFQGDASENVHSLDYLYGLEHPIMPQELWAEKGDLIFALSPINQNGRNLRTNKEGNFPIYLLKKYTKFENFLAFANITL
ncbi:hypothetical protein Mgra_00006996 [Meloidogyne graminicola]|uniref:GT23 domain-containing protein n=1 Tax=Meloidogyne graminicola TaxID=189291 RepID=A0A8S9ZJW2_9BILA|nr:hypothetical protein Mgra_00006996 [Meloidogyne graminicola]